jgi:hypothetical protein
MLRSTSKQWPPIFNGQLEPQFSKTDSNFQRRKL